MADWRYHARYSIPWTKLWFSFVAASLIGLLIGMATGNITPAPKGANSDCYTDWDGHSNPTVCD